MGGGCVCVCEGAHARPREQHQPHALHDGWNSMPTACRRVAHPREATANKHCHDTLASSTVSQPGVSCQPPGRPSCHPHLGGRAAPGRATGSLPWRVGSAAASQAPQVGRSGDWPILLAAPTPRCGPHLAGRQQRRSLLDVGLRRHGVIILQVQHGNLDVLGQLVLCGWQGRRQGAQPAAVGPRGGLEGDWQGRATRGDSVRSAGRQPSTPPCLRRQGARLVRGAGVRRPDGEAHGARTAPASSTRMPESRSMPASACAALLHSSCASYSAASCSRMAPTWAVTGAGAGQARNVTHRSLGHRNNASRHVAGAPGRCVLTPCAVGTQKGCACGAHLLLIADRARLHLLQRAAEGRRPKAACQIPAGRQTEGA